MCLWWEKTPLKNLSLRKIVMALEENLSKLGLSKNETKIYLMLIKQGSKSATKLSQGTQVNRRSTYDSLEDLISKGLVSYKIEEKKKIFSATQINSISALIEEQKTIAFETEKALAQIKTQKQEDPQIEIFVGKQSLKGIFEGILDDTKTFYIYGGAMNIREYLLHYYLNWTNRRKEKKIKLKGIFVDLPGVRKFVKELPLTQAKFIEKENLSPAFWWLKGDVVYLVFFQQTPTIIKIKSASLAKTYKHSFNIIWDNLTK